VPSPSPRASIGSASDHVVVVATTGHTDLDPARLTAIRALVARALDEIARAATDALRQRAHGRRDARLVLVSCLAPGADQLVAGEAVRRGFELHVVIPGTVASYRAQLGEPVRDEFDRLLCTASALAETGPALPSGDDDASARARRAEYAAATRHMLRHSDLLIAVADVLHRRELGITGDGVRAALWAGRPVLWVDPSRADRLRWLSHLSEEELDEQLRAPAGSRFVPDLVPDDRASSGDLVADTLREKVATVLADRRAGLCYRAERLPSERSRIVRWPAALWDTCVTRRLPARLPPSAANADAKKAAGGRRDGPLARWWRRQRGGYAVAWAMLRSLRFGAGATAARDEAASAAAGGDAAGVVVSSVVEAVERERSRARTLAAFYGGAHRSSFLVIALLAVVAVAFASIPGGEGEHAGSKTTYALAELAILVTMFAIYYANRTRRWQERSLDYRLLAERYRHATALLLVGSTEWTGGAAPPAQYGDLGPGKTWIEPYFDRSMARIVDRLDARTDGAPPRPRFDDDPANATYVRACRSYVLDDWLASQARYHEETAARYEALDLLLEATQFTLLLFTIAVCVVHVVVRLPWLTFLAGVLPALSASLTSIAGQAEVVRLRDRSLSMQRTIARTLGALAQDGAATSAASLRHVVESSAQRLLEEAIEWRVLFRFRPISSP
jgi:hypothetical protein